MGIDRISPGIDDDIGLDTGKIARRIRMQRDRIMMFARVCPRYQVFAPVLYPAHRAFHLHRHPGYENLLRQQHAFIAETAADIGRDDAYLVLAQAEAFAEGVFQDMGNLRCAVNHKPVFARVPFGEHRRPFERVYRLTVHAEGAGYGHAAVLYSVRISLEQGIEDDVVFPVVMHSCRGALERRQHIDHRRQRIEFKTRPNGEIFGPGAGIREAHGHGFPDKTQLAGREMGIVRAPMAGEFRNHMNRLHPVRGEVGGGENPVAGVFRPGDGQVCAMGDGAADNRRFKHPGPCNIRDIAPGPLKEAPVFLAQDPRADPMSRSAVRHDVSPL